jgi:hypothetical protein
MSEHRYALVTMKYVANTWNTESPEAILNEARDTQQALEDVMYESDWDLGGRYSTIELLTAAEIKARTDGVIDLDTEEEE